MHQKVMPAYRTNNGNWGVKCKSPYVLVWSIRSTRKRYCMCHKVHALFRPISFCKNRYKSRQSGRENDKIISAASLFYSSNHQTSALQRIKHEVSRSHRIGSFGRSAAFSSSKCNRLYRHQRRSGDNTNRPSDW